MIDFTRTNEYTEDVIKIEVVSLPEVPEQTEVKELMDLDTGRVVVLQ